MFALPPAVPTTRSAAPAAPAPAPTVAPTISQQVEVVPVQSRTDMLVSAEQWTWEELRDYVVAQITERFGPFPRDARKEYGIFTRFFTEYGADAAAIAQYAFGPACDGWWGRAPISVNRFCKASDPYFARPIRERLADTGALHSN